MGMGVPVHWWRRLVVAVLAPGSAFGDRFDAQTWLTVFVKAKTKQSGEQCQSVGPPVGRAALPGLGGPWESRPTGGVGPTGWHKSERLSLPTTHPRRERDMIYQAFRAPQT